jgi:ribosome-binding protein aMBF1 (putative translation factor)
MNSELQTKLRSGHRAQARSIRKVPSYSQVKRDFEIEYKVATELTKARKTAGLTQKDVARFMGTTQSVISRIERGSNVSIETLERYVSVCGCHLQIRIV